jgi:hypothetical protein
MEVGDGWAMQSSKTTVGQRSFPLPPVNTLTCPGIVGMSIDSHLHEIAGCPTLD